MYRKLPTGQKQQATPSTVRKILDRLQSRESANPANLDAHRLEIQDLAYLLGIFQVLKDPFPEIPLILE